MGLLFLEGGLGIRLVQRRSGLKNLNLSSDGKARGIILRLGKVIRGLKASLRCCLISRHWLISKYSRMGRLGEGEINLHLKQRMQGLLFLPAKVQDFLVFVMLRLIRLMFSFLRVVGPAVVVSLDFHISSCLHLLTRLKERLAGLAKRLLSRVQRKVSLVFQRISLRRALRIWILMTLRL